MSEVRLVAPLRSMDYAMKAERADGAPVTGASTTVKLFNRELGELNRLQRTAQQRGEVVTQAEIQLEFEMRNKMLAARSANTAFASREPSPTPAEVVGKELVETKAEEKLKAEPEQGEGADEAKKMQPAHSRDLNALQAKMADKMTRLNASLTRPGEDLAANSPEAETKSVDTTA